MMSRTFRPNKNQQELVNQLIEEMHIHLSDPVIDTLLSVDRGDFCKTNPYHDAPQYIGFNVVISAPHLHASALHYLYPKLYNGARALDIGSGTGYLTTCLAKMIEPKGIAVGVEHIPELVEESIQNIRKSHERLLETGSIKMVMGNGRVGYEPYAPYDVIHVGAMAGEPPKELLDQLSIGGRLLMPIGNDEHQDIMLFDKISSDLIERTRLFGVRYVPLTSKEGQLGIVRTRKYEEKFKNRENKNETML